MIRVRIAPSPTGFAHVGTAYMALFNFAYARKNKGTFIVRLEDTDIKRNVKGAEGAIYEGLAWLGLSWDEGPDKGGKYGPYRASERLELYQKKVQVLLDNGLAYKDKGAIRFKNPGKDVTWKDAVRGDISFPGGEVTDFVLIKSDGFPTYNFGVVIDDISMEISHVIRGEEHISNTPRQLALYQALGVEPPVFAHLPTLRNKDRKKLSKRRDPVDLRIFRNEGYLPEALINFLCLMGWSHPEGKEIFSLKEFVNQFDLGRVRKAGPIFDLTKLDWLNGEYIRQTSLPNLVDLAFNYYDGKSKKELLTKVVPLVKDRIKKLSDIEPLAGFLLKENPPKPLKIKPFYTISILNATYLKLSKISKDSWNLSELNIAFEEIIKETGCKTGDFYMFLRGVIAGSKFTPPINESIVILGKDKTLKRLKK